MSNKNFLNYYMNNLSEDILKASDNCYDKFIESIMEDTGFNKKCAIKVAETFFDLNYKLKTENDKYFIILDYSWKEYNQLDLKMLNSLKDCI